MKLIQRIFAYLSKWGKKSEPETPTPIEGHKKLAGFDYLDILYVWVKLNYSGCNVIVLTDVNTQAKDVEFWARIPKGQALEFLKDVTVLFCKDKSEMEKLVPSIGTEFATAYGFSDGNLVISNKETLCVDTAT